MRKIIVDANIFINSFSKESAFRDESVDFLSIISNQNQLISMPAHGLFEITCSLKRLSEIDKKYIHPIILGKSEYPIEAIHIDSEFIRKYSGVDVPYTKAGDHLYLVVAKYNGYPLITRDGGLTKRAKEAGVRVFTPTEYLSEVNYA